MNKQNNIHKLKYYYSIPSLLGPFNLKAEAYYEKYNSIYNSSKSAQYIRLDIEVNKNIRWARKRYFNTRIATSFFPMNTERDRNSIGSRNDQGFIRGSSGAAFQGYLDYTNENDFLGRTATQGLWSRQVEIRQGGLKIAPGVAQRTNLGNTNSFLLAANFSSDLPIKFVGQIFRPYFDIASVSSINNGVKEMNTLYSGGIQLHLIPEVFDIYLPIFHSENIRSIYRADSKNYFNQVCFSLKFNFDHIKDIANFVK